LTWRWCDLSDIFKTLIKLITLLQMSDRYTSCFHPSALISPHQIVWMRKTLLLSIAVVLLFTARSQTLGGSTVFNFLRLPNTPQLTALGGINISQQSNDIGLVFHNPALLREGMHQHLHAAFNSFYGGISAYNLVYGLHHAKLNTNFAIGVHYLNYGSVPQTDAGGLVLGNFRPRDYVVQWMASRRYLEKWHYGATLKIISSNYGQFRSNGIAVDVGVNYVDSANQLQVGLAAKNMGVQLKHYGGSLPEDLPFDLQLGISKRLAKAPVQFSLTAHHLHQFDIRYNDTLFNASRHIIFATQFYIGNKIELTAAYNHLRRQELNIANTVNGLNGFSLGLGVLLPKLKIRFARGYYQNNTANNQLGIVVSFGKL
jgi:hypothetical protein